MGVTWLLSPFDIFKSRAEKFGDVGLSMYT